MTFILCVLLICLGCWYFLFPKPTDKDDLSITFKDTEKVKLDEKVDPVDLIRSTNSTKILYPTIDTSSPGVKKLLYIAVGEDGGQKEFMKEIRAVSYTHLDVYKRQNQSKWNYAVGQLMVWEYLGYKPTDHNVPNYEKRKAEVNEMIKNMTKRPSFNGKTVTLNAGESTTLTDTNNVLQDFKGKESIPKGITAKRSGNKLTITASASASENSTCLLYTSRCV